MGKIKPMCYRNRNIAVGLIVLIFMSPKLGLGTLQIGLRFRVHEYIQGGPKK